MFEIILYSDSIGRSQIGEFIEDLKGSSKSSRINFIKVVAYIRILEEKGTSIGMPVVRYLRDGIWEMRPLSNRILFANVGHDRYLLLHSFRKTTNKTPKKEIDRAKRELADYYRRESI